MQLGTDLRAVSTGQPKSYERRSALTHALGTSSEQQQQLSPWLAAAEQLSLFPPQRCVQMQPQDWQQLSTILASISRQCGAAVKASNTSTVGSSCPAFAATLELLARLGAVTSALLCVNGDDKCFSIARVAQVGGQLSQRRRLVGTMSGVMRWFVLACTRMHTTCDVLCCAMCVCVLCTMPQAIRTTASVLEAAIAQAAPAGLSAEVADSLARQRCEQTPLLSAVTWALRQVRKCGSIAGGWD